MQSIIICATPRSGSYLLSDLLSQKGLPFAEEWLTQFHRNSRKRAYGVKNSLEYVPFLKLLTEREQRNGLFTMKVMFPQFYELSQQLNSSGDIPGAGFVEKFTHVFPNPRFIRISRENKVAQAISLLKARQTGQWVKREGENDPLSIKPVYSFLGITDALRERQRSEELWDEIFESYPFDSFQLTYEELVANKQGALGRILEWAGLESPAIAEGHQPENFRPMSSSTNREWLDRFERDLQAANEATRVDRVGELNAISLSSVDLRDSYEIGKRHVLEIRGCFDADEPVIPTGRADGTGWLRVSGLVSGHGVEETFEQELQLTDGNNWKAPSVLPVPGKAGEYCLKLTFSSKPLSAPQIQDSAGIEYPVNFGHPPARAAARRLFPDTQDLEDSWQYLDWFGYFLDDKFPWIYHADHEWLFVKDKPTQTGSFEVLDAQLGWLEIDPTAYPEVRVIKDGKRWVFRNRREDKRLFLDPDTDTIREFETNRPEHLEKLGTGES